jgi:hypothetical protein
MTRLVVRSIAGLSLLLLACMRGDSRPLVIGPIEALRSPAGAGSGEPNLATTPSGRVYLSWLEPEGASAHSLRFATLESDAWSLPRTIAQRSDFFVNWADFPSVVPLAEGRLAAHWLQRNGSAKYGYDVRVTQSSDGGETWSIPVVPHRDGTVTEHGFVSLFPFHDSLGAIWLDGRNFADAAKGEGADMMLVMTSVAPDGTTGPEHVLDERVCDCCQTSLAVVSSGPIVAYRDRSEGEVRDIAILRWSQSGWTSGTVVHPDGWKIDFCPVNGPAIAADGPRVAVAWFTAARDTARVYLARSDDAGATFSPPTRIDDGNPVGRVDVELDDRGGAVVSWMEFTSGRQADVRVRHVTADGVRSASRTVAQSSGERATGFPRMVATGDHLVFAWTDTRSSAGVRVARARLSSPR